jgi:hypothetical protein
MPGSDHPVMQHHVPEECNLQLHHCRNLRTFVDPSWLLPSRFPSDVQTYDIDEQFLWGSALMIVPVLEEVRKF